MAGLFAMGGGVKPTLMKAGFNESTVDQIEAQGRRNGGEIVKPEAPPPEPGVELNDALPGGKEDPPPAAPAPAPTPPATPKPAAEAIVTPLPDPYAGKRGEVARLAQARARRSQKAATIIGSDTLG